MILKYDDDDFGFVCDRGHGHVIRFVKDGECVLYVDAYLLPYVGFWRRLVTATRYLFGGRSATVRGHVCEALIPAAEARRVGTWLASL